ncbi:alpha-(1,6)-fucosyltransferase-like [Clavelina lepadiformis]|uniref:alpha-(1,6)-fucosyltransferase-like n=1 Tax=Clavelina lepadiformis TaxID=159417 RepID=UPI004041D369
MNHGRCLIYLCVGVLGEIIVMTILTDCFTNNWNHLSVLKSTDKRSVSQELSFLKRDVLKKPSLSLKQRFTKQKEELKQMYTCLLDQQANIAKHKTLRDCNLKGRVNFLLNELETISQDVLSPEMDGLAEKLRMYTAKKFYDKQNPKDCRHANVLQCAIDWMCGYGCFLRHYITCFNIGISLNRTVLITTRRSGVAFNSMHKPISESCENVSLSCNHVLSADTEKATLENERCVIFRMKMRPPADQFYLSYSVPRDIFPLIFAFNSEPLAWWNGQITSFIMRPQKWLENVIKHKEETALIKRPIVGVHIRADKEKNKIYPVSHYMAFVEQWWIRYEQQQQLAGKHISSIVRRLYIATDKSWVVPQVRKDYPNYHITHDEKSTNHSSPTKRKEMEGAVGFVTDVHALSKCDFVVCGFTSHVCQAVFHLMQSHYTDASDRMVSVSGNYNPELTSPITSNRYVAAMDHVASPKSGELNMTRGDALLVFDIPQFARYSLPGKGYYWVNNTVSGEIGSVPSYKIKPFLRTNSVPFL